MSDTSPMAGAIAAAQAAFAADEMIRNSPPGTAGRRERMARIIHEIADAWEVERVDLTMALTQASVRKN